MAGYGLVFVRAAYWPGPLGGKLVTYHQETNKTKFLVLCAWLLLHFYKHAHRSYLY